MSDAGRQGGRALWIGPGRSLERADRLPDLQLKLIRGQSDVVVTLVLH